MPVHNSDIEAIFNEVADLLEIKGENPFRVRAYRSAARMVAGLSQSVSAMVAQGQDLSQLPPSRAGYIPNQRREPASQLDYSIGDIDDTHAEQLDRGVKGAEFQTCRDVGCVRDRGRYCLDDPLLRIDVVGQIGMGDRLIR